MSASAAPLQPRDPIADEIAAGRISRREAAAMKEAGKDIAEALDGMHPRLALLVLAQMIGVTIANCIALTSHGTFIARISQALPRFVASAVHVKRAVDADDAEAGHG